MGFKHWLMLALALGAGVVVWLAFLRSAPPEIPFTRAKRGALRSIVGTNGQVEPLTTAEIRAETSGRVGNVLAAQGDTVARSAVLVHLEDTGSEARIREAQAAVHAAQTRLEHLSKEGGFASRRLELEGQLQEALLNRQHAERDLEAVRRLAAASAATPREVEAEERRVRQASETVASLQAQLGALGNPAEVPDARAEESRAIVRMEQAKRERASAHILSPIGGTLYEFSVKPGGWVQTGELVGRVGDASSVRVRVFVDEPELGRVREGMPVLIQWDAVPGAEWKGVIEQLPARIQAFGSRQVGEVLCRIGNPEGNLLPGANVNAEIVSAEKENALLLPKQAVRRRLGEEGVWKLESGAMRWQPVKTGISSVTEVEVLEGLSEGDSVALLVDRELREGMPVKPVHTP